MKELMPWNECTKAHIKKVEPDRQKISSIVKMCNVRLRVLEQILLDAETASVIASDYYEIIKELLTAILLKEGLKSDNHECLIRFFKVKFPEYEYEAETIHKLKDVRNRVSYDGIFVDKEYIEMNNLEFKHIIEILKKLLEKGNIK